MIEIKKINPIIEERMDESTVNKTSVQQKKATKKQKQSTRSKKINREPSPSSGSKNDNVEQNEKTENIIIIKIRSEKDKELLINALKNKAEYESKNNPTDPESLHVNSKDSNKEDYLENTDEFKNINSKNFFEFAFKNLDEIFSTFAASKMGHFNAIFIVLFMIWTYFSLTLPFIDTSSFINLFFASYKILLPCFSILFTKLDDKYHWIFIPYMLPLFYCIDFICLKLTFPEIHSGLNPVVLEYISKIMGLFCLQSFFNKWFMFSKMVYKRERKANLFEIIFIIYTLITFISSASFTILKFHFLAEKKLCNVLFIINVVFDIFSAFFAYKFTHPDKKAIPFFSSLFYFIINEMMFFHCYILTNWIFGSETAEVLIQK